MPQSEKKRAANFAERQKTKGLVKISVSAWVNSDNAEAAKSAANRALKKYKINTK